jgi:acetolactate synthase I/III small subunit
MSNGKFVIGIIVSNQFGVLTRVSGLFARRGFNIDSLTVGETGDPLFSRMTITATGDDYTKEQIVKQLSKLHDVKKIEIMMQKDTVIRELLLIKIKATQENRSNILEAVSVFRAKVVDFNSDSISVEITGEESKLSAFIDYAGSFGILEICRTGVTAMKRGNICLMAK